MNICKGLHFKESFEDTASLIKTLQRIKDEKLKKALAAKYNYKNSKAALELGKKSHEEVLILEYKYKTARAILDSFRNCLKAIEAKEKSLKNSKKVQLEKQDKEIKHAKAQLEHAESMLKKTKLELEKTIVKSPADGIVILGESLESRKLIGKDDPVAFILKPKSTHIIAKFKSESLDINSGDKVEIIFDNSDDVKVPGDVEEIMTPLKKSNLGRNDLLTLRVKFNETESLKDTLYPGLKARVKLSSSK